MPHSIAKPQDLDALLADLPGPHDDVAAQARARQDTLTKPPGSLGRLEDIAVWCAGWRGSPEPRLERLATLVFAGNHGVTARGISAFPADVTKQMVANFETGGAAVNQLCTEINSALGVFAIDLDNPTGDITAGPAMSDEDCLHAINVGMTAVPDEADAVLLGEMGIGNTTIAAALAAACFGGSGADWAGPGTGLDASGVVHKAAVVDEALALHRDHLTSPFEILRRLGGREQAALAGAALAARLNRTPVILDGFITTASVGVLARTQPSILDHCLAGHRSGEPGHGRLLDALKLDPLLDLGMRLGEGSGAAVALSVVNHALALHRGMATFAEAGVSSGN